MMMYRHLIPLAVVTHLWLGTSATSTAAHTEMRSLLRSKFHGYDPARHDPRRRPPPDQTREELADACPATIAAVVESTGFVPVPMFQNNSTHPNDKNDSSAVRGAINATKYCGGTVFFPGGMFGSTAYTLHATVTIGHGDGPIALQGAGTASAGLTQTPPATMVHGPVHKDGGGPVFIVTATSGVHFRDLEIIGWYTGVIITDAAAVRFTNVAIQAQAQAPGPDDVGLTASTCVSCNIVFGSNNSALIVQNSFWVWITDSMFSFVPMIHANGTTWNAHQGGQRPSIILRGDTAGP